MDASDCKFRDPIRSKRPSHRAMCLQYNKLTRFSQCGCIVDLRGAAFCPPARSTKSGCPEPWPAVRSKEPPAPVNKYCRSRRLSVALAEGDSTDLKTGGEGTGRASKSNKDPVRYPKRLETEAMRRKEARSLAVLSDRGPKGDRSRSSSAEHRSPEHRSGERRDSDKLSSYHVRSARYAQLNVIQRFLNVAALVPA